MCSGYHVWLSKSAHSGLYWIGNRYEYSDLLIKYLSPSEDVDDHSGEGTYWLSETEAWLVVDAIDNEDGFLPCAGGDLADAIVKLYEEVV
jgi:hypothetical protein